MDDRFPKQVSGSRSTTTSTTITTSGHAPKFNTKGYKNNTQVDRDDDDDDEDWSWWWKPKDKNNSPYQVQHSHRDTSRRHNGEEASGGEPPVPAGVYPQATEGSLATAVPADVYPQAPSAPAGVYPQAVDGGSRGDPQMSPPVPAHRAPASRNDAVVRGPPVGSSGPAGVYPQVLTSSGSVPAGVYPQASGSNPAPAGVYPQVQVPTRRPFGGVLAGRCKPAGRGAQPAAAEGDSPSMERRLLVLTQAGKGVLGAAGRAADAPRSVATCKGATG